jgi:hypothetical protein
VSAAAAPDRSRLYRAGRALVIVLAAIVAVPVALCIMIASLSAERR